MCRGLTIGHLSRCDSLGIVVRKLRYRGAKGGLSWCGRWGVERQTGYPNHNCLNIKRLHKYAKNGVFGGEWVVVEKNSVYLGEEC